MSEPSIDNAPHDAHPAFAAVLLHWRNGDAITRKARDVAAWRMQPTIFIVENEPLALPDDLRARSIALAPDHNLGYAGGVNFALREISRRGIRYALLLNADIECPEDTARGLLHAIERDPTIGLIGPLLEDLDANGRILFSAGGRNPVWRPRTRRAFASAPDVPQIKEVAYTPGTVCLLRMALLDRTGLLEESYFFSGEIADLGWRARRAGYRCAVHTGVRARHFSGDAGPLRETLYLYFILRNRFLLARRCAPLVWPLAWVWWTALALLIAARQRIKGRRASARAALRAVRDGWRKEYGHAPADLAA